MDIRTKNYGRNHPKSASTMSHMGNVEFMLCNYESAGRHLDEALNIQLQFFPKNHPAIATSYFRKARLALAQDKFAEATQYMGVCYSARKERLGENHPSVAASLSGMADILAGNFLLKEALDQQSKSITSLRSFYSTTPFHATVIQSSVSLAKTLQLMSRFEDAISVFEQCLEMQKAQMESLNVTQHLLYIDISLLYVDALLAVGKVIEAANIVGKCGVSIFSMFKVERHLKSADCLYHLANVSKAQGRFKDAKYQYSLALTIKNQNMLQYNHLDICRIIAGAADNMREVGYFHDAFEACSTLESFISSMQCEESVREVHQTLASILHAKILVDRGKAILAETMFDAATKVVVRVFGEKSMQFLEIKIGLSRCYQQLNKINQAEKGMEEAVEIAKELLGMASPITFETISTMHFLKSYLNTKPTEQSKACEALAEEVLPFFAEHSGIAHPLTVHTRGRIGIFMNKAKKDSGRKMIFDALKIFDRYKQFPFTYDHPWIQEMGGFEKRANVKERLSHTIEEFAIASWAMPSYEGDRSFGVVPKSIWIDLKNFAEEAWGSVQYYGGDKPADVASGAGNDATQPTPFARLRLSKSLARKIMPSSTPAPVAASSVVAASKVTKTSVSIAPVVEANVVGGGNEEALLSEVSCKHVYNSMDF
jgi:tetratricopeptide (TPR) repeat protein